ncbi:MAG: DNA polymerase III subunit chi [Gammaproteobacteria bacterium]|nr:DNA polymerase III subunit chi [Gammaproteobacteria bacterium]
MTRIDFYILPDVDSESKFRFACRLAHRAIADGGQAHVRTASAEATAALDALMWSYPEGRFLPHSTADDDPSLVCIGHEEPPPGPDELLINLSDDIPEYFDRFERVCEVVPGPELAAGRARYGQYRRRGFPLHHHELDDWETAR